jgi:alpha-amylase
MNDSPQQDELTRRHVLNRVSGGVSAAFVGADSAQMADPATEPADTQPQATASSSGESVVLQYFHEDWVTIKNDLDRVSDWGFDAIWLMQPAEGALKKENQDRNNNPLGYQPIDLRNFNSEWGIKSELTTLIDTAHEKGVEVYLDTVLNHMAAEDYDAFPWFGSQDFHNEGGIPDWAYNFNTTDPDADCFKADGTPRDPDKIECHPWWVENGDLLGLKDLKHEKDYVRGELKTYMEDMAALGADGYRFDAAKHIPESFFGHLREPVGRRSEHVPGR